MQKFIATYSFLVVMVLFCLPKIASGNCTISTTALNFGEIVLPTTDPVPAEATVTVNCAGSVQYKIEINDGNNPDPPYRTMTNKISNALRYDLFQDPGYNTRWTRDNYNGGSARHATGTKGLNEMYTIYGVTLPSVSTALGSYSDSVTVSVIW